MNFGTDIFGWTGRDEHYEICLGLNLKAKTTLMESHPSIDKKLFVKVGENMWRIKTMVYSLEPVISFYLSMADCVDIMESKDSDLLKSRTVEYVNEVILPRLRNCAE